MSSGQQWTTRGEGEDGGEEAEFGPGDVMVVPPGHDAWVVGDEPCVALDWTGTSQYAKR